MQLSDVTLKIVQSDVRLCFFKGHTNLGHSPEACLLSLLMCPDRSFVFCYAGGGPIISYLIQGGAKTDGRTLLMG